MSIQIGRVSLDTATLDDPVSWEQAGDQVRVTANIAVNSVTHFKTLRQQILGLADNPWESDVPVVWSLDPTQTGYYRVLDSQVTSEQMSLVNGFGTVQITLLRLPGYSQSWLESILNGAARSGTPGGVTPSTWHGVQGFGRGNYDTPGGTPTGTTRTGPDGICRIYTDATYYYDARALQYRAPSNWDDMAATIKLDGVTVVGRQIPGNGTTLTLSNGLVTFTFPSGSDVFSFTPPVGATPNTAGTAIPMQVGIFSGSWGGLTAGGTQTITRNCVAECGVRLAIPGAADSVVVDFNLRRGSYFGNVTIGSTTSAKYGLGVTATTALTALASGGGHRRTSNDGDGNRIVICSAKTYTADTVNGRLYLTSAGTFHDMAVGVELNGSSASSPNQATDIRDQFFAAITETQNVIAR